jgi:hypothetical protein
VKNLTKWRAKMTYDKWLEVREKCWNEEQMALQRMSLMAQTAMKKAHKAGAIIETLQYDGEWAPSHDIPSWNPGKIIRVDPSWPGPPRPEAKPGYVDTPVASDGMIYRIANPTGNTPYWLLPMAPTAVGFAGYVYETDGREWCSPALICDKQPDGSYRLRVPKAVRFVKGTIR